MNTIEQSKIEVYVEIDYEGESSWQEERSSSIDWASWFQIWLDYLSDIPELPKVCELSLKLMSDRQIQQFNARYRGMDKATDVLAFAAQETEIALPEELDEPVYLGDLIISLDTAVRQAEEQNHSLSMELAWLASHGLLHLLGWDHPDDESLQAMLERQSHLVNVLEITCNN